MRSLTATGARRLVVDVAELTLAVLAPTPDRAVLEDGAGVIGAGSDRDGAGQPGDRDRGVPLGRRPIAEFAEGVVTPARHRARSQQGTDVVAARRDRDRVAHPGDRSGGLPIGVRPVAELTPIVRTPTLYPAAARQGAIVIAAHGEVAAAGRRVEVSGAELGGAFLEGHRSRRRGGLDDGGGEGHRIADVGGVRRRDEGRDGKAFGPDRRRRGGDASENDEEAGDPAHPARNAPETDSVRGAPTPDPHPCRRRHMRREFQWSAGHHEILRTTPRPSMS